MLSVQTSAEFSDILRRTKLERYTMEIGHCEQICDNALMHLVLAREKSSEFIPYSCPCGT